MASVAHFSTPSQTELIGKMTGNGKSKIPEYAKNFKNEWLCIIGINKKCGEFSKKLSITTEEDKVFLSQSAKKLIQDLKNVLEAQRVGKFQNISNLNFKLSAVEKIITLRIDLYSVMVNYLDVDFVVGDEEFQDFFENFIIFTNSTNIKYEENFEDDTFDINDYRGTYTEIDSDSYIFGSESESDSD